MQVHHLVVFDGQVVPSLLQVGNLHEVAAGEGLADVRVIIPGTEVCAGQLDPHSGGNTHLEAS